MDSHNYLHADIFSEILDPIRNYIAGMSNAEITSTVIIVSAALLFIFSKDSFRTQEDKRFSGKDFLMTLYSIQLHKVIYSE